MTKQQTAGEMDARTLEALRKSIAHWEENVEVETVCDVKTGPEDCALCAAFMNRGGVDKCKGCPVRTAVGRRKCARTPYDRAYIARQKWRFGNGTHDQFRTAAQAELSFLKSLWPIGEPR